MPFAQCVFIKNKAPLNGAQFVIDYANCCASTLNFVTMSDTALTASFVLILLTNVLVACADTSSEIADTFWIESTILLFETVNAEILSDNSSTCLKMKSVSFSILPKLSAVV